MTFRVLLGGDVWPMSLGPGELASRLGLRHRPDLAVWTLDACLPVGAPRVGHAHFPFDPRALERHRLGERDVVVTAANHAADYGPEGFLAVRELLEREHFIPVGTGPTLEAASRAVELETPAGRIAIIAMAETVPRVDAVAATPDSPGVNPWDLPRALETVSRLKARAAHVWVVLHWGEEFVRYPDPEQRAAAYALVEAGATLVMASHTHVPLGFERIGAATVFYGLGNFLYSDYRVPRAYAYRLHPMGQVGLFVEGEFREGQFEWLPVRIRADLRGMPTREAELGDACPDYGATVPYDPASYPRTFARLRRRERAIHVAQRLAFMTGEERLFRARQLLGRISLSRS